MSPFFYMKIYIIGFMASGKTTMGKILAEALNMPFYDIDQLIETQEDITINEIFIRSGEEYFRHLESEMLQNFTEDAVYSCGGGIISGQTSLRILQQKNDLIIWLNPEWNIIANRITSSSRPLAEGKSIEQLFEFYVERVPLYESIADIEYRGTELNKLLSKIKKMPGFETGHK